VYSKEGTTTVQKNLQEQNRDDRTNKTVTMAKSIHLVQCRSHRLAAAFVIAALFLSHVVDSFSPIFPGTRQHSSRLSPDLRLSDSDDEMDAQDATGPSSVNVLGTALQPCCTDVRGTGMGTGFYRNGYCSTGEQDLGRHTVCVEVTDEFLEYSASVGNNLGTPFPQYLFPGLKEGDIWCLCATRWAQALEAGKAPKLFLQATHEKTLDYVSFDVLREYAVDKDEADRRLEGLNEQREKLNKLL
jgi:uncharacterized protein (DUF2237 family)